MKNLLFLIALALMMPACSTMKQASTDFTNFKKTLELNAGRPVVYKNAYF
jgi:hypothetical protein